MVGMLHEMKNNALRGSRKIVNIRLKIFQDPLITKLDVVLHVELNKELHIVWNRKLNTAFVMPFSWL